MTRIKGQLTTADYLTLEDFNRLVEGLHKDGKYLWELYCRLSFCMALRGSDILSLYWRDILNTQDVIKKEQKTSKCRHIHFHTSVKEKITELYKLLETPDINSPVFYNSRMDKPYSLEYINQNLKKFRVRYRLPIKAFSTHSFRKTFGRYIWEQGGRTSEALIKLSMIFQHSSPKITMIYLGIRQDELNEIYETIQFS